MNTSDTLLEVASSPPSSAGEETGRLEDAAARFVHSLEHGPPVELAPELERMLRGLIYARALRSQQGWRERSLGIDAADVVQRVMLRMLESRPHFEDAASPLKRLIAWTKTVTQNYLADLAVKHSETLDERAVLHSHLRLHIPQDALAERRLDARRALDEARRLIAEQYPIASPLFENMLESPHATSRELARSLHTTAANIDQMRSRIRKLLREQLRRQPRGERS